MTNINFNYKLIICDGSKIEDSVSLAAPVPESGPIPVVESTSAQKDMLEMIDDFKKQIDILEIENLEKENIKFTVPPYPKYLPRMKF